MERRRFLAAVVAASALPRMGWADAGDPAYLAAAREPDGTYALFGLSAAGDDLFRIALPDRGHAAAAHPTAPEAVAFARRPGTFALVIDCAEGRVLHRLTAPGGRHFQGHGAFLQGGAVLVTTETDYETGDGRLGLWSRADGYARMGEVASGGIGPHEVLALPGEVLAVANGGMRADPLSEREVTNLDTMAPNLAYVTLRGGVEEVVALEPTLHHLSIRHLAAADGLVAFAMQWQGDLSDPVPLLGLHRRGAAPVLAEADLAEQLAMQGYAGSVAISGAISGGTVGLTSPRGGRLHVFDLAGGFRRSLPRADICGLAACAGGLVATDGLGGILETAGEGFAPLRAADRAWDNHLIRIAPA